MTALPKEELEHRVAVYLKHNSERKAADELGIAKSSLNASLKRAAEIGLMGTAPVLPGFRLTKTTAVTNADGDIVREFIQQRPDLGEEFSLPDGHSVKGMSALVDASGRTIQQWVKTSAKAEDQMAAFRAMVEALKEELPRVTMMLPPATVAADLLNQYTVTDNHFGMLSWREETGSDYDLRIAEELILDWFSAAIANSPQAHTGLLAQLGDLMHHDALESVTPAHRHVLDADSRLQKVIRIVIRAIRRIIDMMLQKHAHVHIVMASGNHDPASSAWLREMLASMYEYEPRISVDNSPSLYYAYEWGETALFYHHFHKRGVKDIDRVFAATFREMYGRCKYHYGHGGHLHSDAVVQTQLMHIERHETLAAPDAYAAGGGWLSGRSAKVITYSRRFGEVGRSTLRPEMVAGKYAAANDNGKKEMAA